MIDIDADKLKDFVGKTPGDHGGAVSVPTARVGLKLGLFGALHRDGSCTAQTLAARTGLGVRYVREWALAQAANGDIAFDPGADRFSLTPALQRKGRGARPLNA